MQESAELKRQLSEAQEEEIRIHQMVEFRRGKRTSGEWMAFCPKCHLPAGEKPGSRGLRVVASCSGFCGWSASIPASLDSIIKELGA